MSNIKLNYNERSWAIDIISKINLFCAKFNSPIRKAGGESTLKSGKKNLFPDVLLYGDELSGITIHGWELKMPDTSVTDKDFIENAQMKASLLNATSFLLWNVKEAVFYIKENNSFIPYKNWVLYNIKTRDDVISNRQSWENLLHEILIFLTDYFSKNSNRTSSLESLSINLYSQTLKEFGGYLANIFKKSSTKDSEFDVEISEWQQENSDKEHSKDKYELLADFSILSWLNRFIFSHYLKTFNPDAGVINSLTPVSSLNDVLKVFHKITSKCDFMNVFIPNVGDKYIDSYFLSYLLQVNEILKDFRLEKIDSKYLHNVIDNAISHSRKKIAGQFSTPSNLAYYLSAITIKDRTAHVIDPCCGSGTIPKMIYQLKKDSDISPEDALDSLWASDKFSYPLQLCSIVLSDPLTLGKLVQVFKKDVFDLQIGDEISFVDPFISGEIKKPFPIMHAAISNLPFVRFESIKSLNDKITENRSFGNIALSNKSDLYASIILYLRNIIEDKGRIGVVISNSWLSTTWGINFKALLVKNFKILKIICSAKGRWFKNADVVTTLLILEKTQSNEDYKIEFITTNKLLEDWNKESLNEMILATLSSKIESKYISKYQYKLKEMMELSKFGISWNALFADFSWFNIFKEKLVTANSLMSINRGERRGWDALFFPEKGHNIEVEYIKPVLKSSRNSSGFLIISANSDSFCCSDTEEMLKRNNKLGALNWISKFKNARNNTGKLLPDVLARASHHWYEMKSNTLADMAISMNPDKHICVFKLRERSFVNQRLIRITVNKLDQCDLLHALLNSGIGLLLIESLGFGRGLGALDLNATNMSEKLHILNPDLLSEENKTNILSAFENLLNRNVLDLPSELMQKDRIKFDREVLKSFNIDLAVEQLYQTILKIYQIRQSVKE